MRSITGRSVGCDGVSGFNRREGRIGLRFGGSIRACCRIRAFQGGEEAE